jgi:hypothetical protein
MPVAELLTAVTLMRRIKRQWTNRPAGVRLWNVRGWLFAVPRGPCYAASRASLERKVGDLSLPGERTDPRNMDGCWPETGCCGHEGDADRKVALNGDDVARMRGAVFAEDAWRQKLMEAGHA